MRPPKSAKNGKKFPSGYCVQKTNELINIEFNNEEKFKTKKYKNNQSSSDSYDNIQEIDRNKFQNMLNSNRGTGSQKSFRGETQKIEFNKALEGLFGVQLEPK